MLGIKIKESEKYIMFCKYCGNKLQEAQRFCSKCGKPNAYFGAQPGAAPAPQQPANPGFAAPAAAPKAAPAPLLKPTTGLLGAYGISNKMLMMAGQVLMFLFQIIFWFCETLQVTVSFDGEKESQGLSIKRWFLEEDVGLESSAFTVLSIIVLVVLMVLAIVRLAKPIVAAYVPAVNTLPVNGILFITTIVFELWYLFWNGLFFIYMIMTADDISNSLFKCTASPTFAGVLAFLIFAGIIATTVMIKIDDVKAKKAAKAARFAR